MRVALSQILDLDRRERLCLDTGSVVELPIGSDGIDSVPDDEEDAQRDTKPNDGEAPYPTAPMDVLAGRVFRHRDSVRDERATIARPLSSKWRGLTSALERRATRSRRERCGAQFSSIRSLGEPAGEVAGMDKTIDPIQVEYCDDRSAPGLSRRAR